MHKHMLLCCGMMTLLVGALGISSMAAAIGFTTGQTYLTTAGFIIAASAVLAVLYRRQTPGRSLPDSPDETKNNS